MWVQSKSGNRSVTQDEFEKRGFTKRRNEDERRSLYKAHISGHAINDMQVDAAITQSNNIERLAISDRDCAKYIVSKKTSKKVESIKSILKAKYSDEEIEEFLIKYEIRTGKYSDLIHARVDIACNLIFKSYPGEIKDDGVVLYEGKWYVPIATFKDNYVSLAYDKYGRNAKYFVFCDDIIDNHTVTIAKMLESPEMFANI